MNTLLNAKIPNGALHEKWDNYKADAKLVNPNNKRKFKVIVVGTGLAGASAAATLAELGYQVDAFTFHDSARRAHSIAAQGGINAAKNYQGDGDSINRLFVDTIKGGDFRSREGNVHRLAQVSVDIIDQMVAQGVPFAREYGGTLDNRSFGGAQVSRTFYARGQTGQQLLLGAYQQLSRQVGLGGVRLFNRTELVDVVVVDGRCSGIVVRDLLTGEIDRSSDVGRASQRDRGVGSRSRRPRDRDIADRVADSGQSHIPRVVGSAGRGVDREILPRRATTNRTAAERHGTSRRVVTGLGINRDAARRSNDRVPRERQCPAVGLNVASEIDRRTGDIQIGESSRLTNRRTERDRSRSGGQRQVPRPIHRAIQINVGIRCGSIRVDDDVGPQRDRS